MEHSLATNHFLIDFENVSSEELKQVKGIKKNDDVVLFYSNACSTYDGCHECFPSVKPFSFMASMQVSALLDEFMGNFCMRCGIKYLSGGTVESYLQVLGAVPQLLL